MTEAKNLIFLVDDDQFLLNMYSLKFKNSGFEVETANSAMTALQKLRDGLKPKVALVDIVMPSMDGLELVTRIKEERLLPLDSIVILTNQGQQTEIERAKALGVGGFIVKASTIPSEVVTEVRKILDKRK